MSLVYIIAFVQQNEHTNEGEHPSADFADLLKMQVSVISEVIFDIDDGGQRHCTLSPKFNKPTDRPPSTTVKCIHDKKAGNKKK